MKLSGVGTVWDSGLETKDRLLPSKGTRDQEEIVIFLGIFRKIKSKQDGEVRRAYKRVKNGNSLFSYRTHGLLRDVTSGFFSNKAGKEGKHGTESTL